MIDAAPTATTPRTAQLSALVLITLAILLMAGWPTRSFGWGDEGHEITALIAERELRPAVRRRVETLLATDGSGLTATDIAAEATWADRWRDSDRNASGTRYNETRQWHYVDNEIERPDLDAACFEHPALPVGVPASAGPPEACIVDKIEQFRRELSSAATAPDERRLALQFLLHFVGDLHQPLHAADNHDQGGNRTRLTIAGSSRGNLHHYWDTVFVAQLGPNAQVIAARLAAHITAAERRAWVQGTVSDWAMQSFAVARQRVYGELPPDARYVADADAAVALQLQRAGVRLAYLLNQSLR